MILAVAEVTSSSITLATEERLYKYVMVVVHIYSPF